jgi:ABC-type sugar transport system substrate-binding protein/AraC-like DNA-binding protein
MGGAIQIWGSGRRIPPPRPEFPEIYPEIDERHWYDLEYVGWNSAKEPLPVSPGDGPVGKRVVCIHHLSGHPYMDEYDLGLKREAERFGIKLELLYSEWDAELEMELVENAIRSEPDMIILSPENARDATALFRRVHGAGIPLIASNLLPEPEGFRYLIAWTGPDDWGQHRLLARKFAELMEGVGGYCLVNHIPGASAYLARRWAVVTELAKMAPAMVLLDTADTGLDMEASRTAVLGWIDRFGPRLKGIISADDSLVQLGINRALAARGCKNVVRVANGATSMGLRFLKDGNLDAMTWQPPDLDGSLPIRVAVDWFNGLAVEPLRYLPAYLIDRHNIDDFLLMRRDRMPVDLDVLSRLFADHDSMGIDTFFLEVETRFKEEHILSEEYFKGLCIELLTRIMFAAKVAGYPLQHLESGAEGLFKNLFLQPTPEDSLAWLHRLARKVLAGNDAPEGAPPPSLAVQLRSLVNSRFREPLSLKTLADHFGISAAYLGKLFREDSGKSFSTYLNERRIEAAMRILKSRNAKVKDVAQAVGFTDPAYFCNVFKKVTGRHPSEIVK